MLIIDDERKFGIFWEVIYQDSTFYYGTVMFVIDNEIFPKKTVFNYTLNTIFYNLKRSLKQPFYANGSTKDELGDKIINNEELSYGRVSNIISIELAELGMAYAGWEGFGSISLELGFNGNKERLFYSEDNGLTFREMVLRKGTVANVIQQLPNDLELGNQLLEITTGN